LFAVQERMSGFQIYDFGFTIGYYGVSQLAGAGNREWQKEKTISLPLPRIMLTN
jgi:hypothetical protein